MDNQFFHVFNKSIADFGIFNYSENAQRFLITLNYYNNFGIKTNLSAFLKREKNYFFNLLEPKENSIVKFISYCVIPDHYHLLLKILDSNISLAKYISDVENSYCRYFNIKSDRKGPLWQSRFKYVKIKTNEQLLHVSRYIHLNPTTNNLVNNPEDWIYSSYKDLITDEKLFKKITEISINNCQAYKKFVEDNKDYQRKLKMIKRLILE